VAEIKGTVLADTINAIRSRAGDPELQKIISQLSLVGPECRPPRRSPHSPTSMLTKCSIARKTEVKSQSASEKPKPKLLHSWCATPSDSKPGTPARTTFSFTKVMPHF
jgi:hypothetical protein